MPRGGRRRGTPGTAYAQRTDLNRPVPVQAATGQPYGAAKAQLDAQRAVPVAPPPSPPQAAAGPSQPAGGPPPGGMGDFLRASERPGEPLTAGIASGAGPGPEALNMTGNPDRDELGAIYMQFPSEGLRQLLEAMDEDDA